MRGPWLRRLGRAQQPGTDQIVLLWRGAGSLHLAVLHEVIDRQAGLMDTKSLQGA